MWCSRSHTRLSENNVQRRVNGPAFVTARVVEIALPALISIRHIKCFVREHTQFKNTTVKNCFQPHVYYSVFSCRITSITISHNNLKRTLSKDVVGWSVLVNSQTDVLSMRNNELTDWFLGFKKNVNRATTQVMMKTGTQHCRAARA